MASKGKRYVKNPVAKYNRVYNKPTTFMDKKKMEDRGYVKHKGQDVK